MYFEDESLPPKVRAAPSLNPQHRTCLLLAVDKGKGILSLNELFSLQGGFSGTATNCCS